MIFEPKIVILLSNFGFLLVINMTGKYQTGKLHKWVLENQKTYMTKLLGSMGRTSDPMGQTREMDTWATSLG